jgi:hypothetical protein
MKPISKFLIVVVVFLLAAFVVVNSLPFVLNTQHPVEMVQGISTARASTSRTTIYGMDVSLFDGQFAAAGRGRILS